MFVRGHIDVTQDVTVERPKPVSGKHDTVTFPGAGMAQLVERPAGKPVALLMCVRVLGAARDCSPSQNFQCRLSYGVHTAPVCNRMH